MNSYNSDKWLTTDKIKIAIFIANILPAELPAAEPKEEEYPEDCRHLQIKALEKSLICMKCKQRWK